MSKTEPELFRSKPAKMLADPTYQSPRLTPKSPQLIAIERRQQKVLPAGVTPIRSSHD